MKLNRVGFFQELKHGDKVGMSLKKAVRNTPSENENKIVEYLDKGVVLCVTAALVSDVLDESKGIIGNLEILTDGIWVWPSDLLYYVKFYHVVLDASFMEHIKKNEWTIPNREDIDLSGLEF